MPVVRAVMVVFSSDKIRLIQLVSRTDGALRGATLRGPEQQRLLWRLKSPVLALAVLDM